MPISKEEFSILAERHRKRIRQLDCALGLLDVLCNSNIITHQEYRNALNIWDDQYDATQLLWSEIKSEYGS